METLAVVASIVAIVQISDRVISSCKFYIQATSDTPSELRAILVEVSTLKSVLETLHFLQTCSHDTPALWKQLSDQNGPLEECRRSIVELEKLFPSDKSHPAATRSDSKRRRLELLGASLAWPLKARRARELLDVIIQQKTMINLALTAELSQEIKSIKKDTTAIRNELTEIQRQDIYRWLEVTDPSPLHNRAWKVHEPQTSGWILRSLEWKKWLNGDARCFWIHGIPGAGKTILTSFVVEQIKQHCRHRQQSGHSYYYCYFAHNQDEASPFLRWTIAQLCRQASLVPDFVYELYKRGGQPSLTELMLALELSLEGFDIVYVIIDAADESKPRKDLLRVIRDLATDTRFTKIHCLVTSREYIDIEQTLEPISHSIPMSNALIEDDIRKHVHSVLHSESRFEHWPSDLLSEVEDAVARKSEGMFRWAICQLDRLHRLRCDHGIIRKALATLPRTLDETYERILIDIPNDEWLFARHALQWICFHQELYEDKRAMFMQILLAATELSIRHETQKDSEFEYDADRLRYTLGSLIIVDEVNAVFFAHYTVKEYLESQRISNSTACFFQTGRRDVIIMFAKLILQEAQEIEWPERKELDCSTEWYETPVVFTQDFIVYCVISGLALMRKTPDVIASDEMTLSLAVDFWNPAFGHYEHIIRVLRFFEEAFYFFSGQNKFDEYMPCWDTQSESTEIIVLLHLLSLSSDYNSPVLAEAFSKRTEISTIAHSKVSFHCTVYPLFVSKVIWVEYGYGDYRFNSSLLEIMAQSSWKHPGSFKWLLDRCNTGIDTNLLLNAIGSHEFWHHEKDCKLKKILNGQADPRALGYAITPLQIAAANRDIEGVIELLEAGADPNALGDRKGVYFPVDSIVSWCNELQGLSPLYICRTFRGPAELPEYHWNYQKDLVENNSPLVEALLLQYGATEYLPPV